MTEAMSEHPPGPRTHPLRWIAVIVVAASAAGALAAAFVSRTGTSLGHLRISVPAAQGNVIDPNGQTAYIGEVIDPPPGTLQPDGSCQFPKSFVPLRLKLKNPNRDGLHPTRVFTSATTQVDAACRITVTGFNQPDPPNPKGPTGKSQSPTYTAAP